MARRPTPPDPELAALARDRLARLLGDGTGAVGPRRAAGTRAVRDDRAEDAAEDAAEDGAEEERGALSPEPASALTSALASARSTPGRDLGPDDLEPPRRFTRWHLAVVAVVLVVGLVWGGWSWVRARPEAVAAPTVGSDAGAPAGAAPAQSSQAAQQQQPAQPSASSGPPAQPGPVVHVLGAVRHPGLVRLEPGARVEDAIEAAGGLERDADPDELNLAQPLDDGVQVVVGTRSRPAGEVRAGGGGSSGGSSGGSTRNGAGGSGGSSRSGSAGAAGAVDLNRASVEQLDTLPGVGPVTAQKILDWREQHGRFSRVEELQEVDGIGPKTYARLVPQVRV